MGLCFGQREGEDGGGTYDTSIFTQVADFMVAGAVVSGLFGVCCCMFQETAGYIQSPR